MKANREGANAPTLAFVAPSAYPLGGVQAWLDYILPGLQSLGWRTELALVSGEFHDASAYLLQHPFDRTYRIAAPTGTRQGRIRALRKCFERARPDIVVGVNIADVYAAVADARARGARGIKAVATLHALQADFLADFGANRDILDAVICTNRLAQRMVRRHCRFAEERALYAPYGVDRVSGEASVRAGNEGGTLKLAYVGRIENEQKRTRDLLLIVQAARAQGVRVDFVIAGEGPDSGKLRSEAQNLGLGEHVRFLGPLSPEAVRRQIYEDSDALIITSLWETGPIVAWEAMAHGVPVLTSAYVGHGAEAALVDGVNCLMFEVGDIGAAVAKIRELTRSDVAAMIGAAGRELALRRYTKERSISQWHEQLVHIMKLPAMEVAPAPTFLPSGRLDRAFGVRLGETIRNWSGLTFRHAEAGGEWPHAYGQGAMDAEDFWSQARALDLRAVSEYATVR